MRNFLLIISVFVSTLLLSFVVQSKGNPLEVRDNVFLKKNTVHCLRDTSLQNDNSLVFLLDGGNQVYYYRGKNCTGLHKISFKQIRKILVKERKETKFSALMILIKSTPAATFKNAIDMLDEIVLAGIPPKHYAEEDITAAEINCINNCKQ